MARKNSATIQEELYSTPGETAREEFDGARLLDLDAEEESPFLRAQKRVPARRGPLPKKTLTKVLWATAAIVFAALFAFVVNELYGYGKQSWLFQLNSSDDIEMSGLGNVTRAQVMEVMRDDLAKNVFSIPLDQRQKQLEQIPWVESASVMRFSPNRIRIEIHERTPVAFARIGSRIQLVDAGGVLMDLSPCKKYSFPVVTGLTAAEPLSARAAKMKIYNELLRQLDAGGAHYSQDLSEVDVSDSEDIKVLTNDPDGAVLVHFGPENYLEQFKLYAAHLRGWREQYQKVASVDLRYWGSGQVVVNPDLRGMPRPPAVSLASQKSALAAGVKPAVLVTPVKTKPSAQHIATIKSAPKKHVLSASRWHKKTAARHPAPHGVVTNASLTTKSQSALRKPSPAIVKEEESR